MVRPRLSRRALLRGASGAVLGLPFLESLAGRTAGAQAVAAPKRLVIMYTSNGTVLKNWTPSALGQNFPLSPILTPFDTPVLRPKLSVLSGVEMASARKVGGNGHSVGMTNLLTGRPFKEVEPTEFGDVGWGGGISIDQELARQTKLDGKLPSIELGVQSQRDYRNFYSYISYAEGGGAGNAVASDDSPKNAYLRLFGNVPDNADVRAELERAIDQRKSVIDFVAEDFPALQGKLGKADQARLDQHLALLRDLESRLSIGPFCAKPGNPTVEDKGIQQNDNFPIVGKAQMDLLSAAFACDLTRIATLQFATAQAGTRFDTFIPGDWSDLPENYHHGISHAAAASDQGDLSASQSSAMDKLTKINTYFAEQLAYLGTKLSQIDDGDGKTALDNTAILWVSEVSEGPTHKFTDMPYVLLGDMGGALKAGEHFNLDGETHNNLFVSLGRALGLDTFSTFGDPEFCTGPISAILA